MLNRQSTDLVRYFLTAYPRRSALIIALLLLSGMAEGIGVASVVPLLELAMDEAGQAPSALMGSVRKALGLVGLEPTLIVLLVVIVIGMFLKGSFMWLSVRQQGYAVAGIATDLRLMLIRAFLTARWSYFVSKPAGEMANAIGYEAQRASMAYSAACGLLAGVIQTMVYVALAVLISPMLAFAAVLTGALVLMLMRGLIGMGRDAGQRQTDLIRSLSSRLIDALYGMKPIKAMGREAELQPLLEDETRELNDAQRRQVVATGILNSFQEPILVVVLAVGIYVAVTRGAITFSALLVLAFLVHRLLGRLQMLQTHYQSLAISESAFWSLVSGVRQAEAEAEGRGGHTDPPPLNHGIELSGVDFGFGDNRVLRGLSMTIRAGEFTVITGASGAGKTTIADLVLGFYSPHSGVIRIDGVPLSDLNLAAWRRMIGYVPQEMLLFHSSIATNVTLGDDTIAEADVIAALEAAGAWEFVSRLPRGIHTVAGEHGARLSGGQRQRIAIARALVCKPRRLVLDEVTTALDPATERAICETLATLAGHVTILAISHQPAMQEIADVVFQLTHGQITIERSAGVTAEPGRG
jgi:ATP-binding cassette, subfamily C, bacterial